MPDKPCIPASKAAVLTLAGYMNIILLRQKDER